MRHAVFPAWMVALVFAGLAWGQTTGLPAGGEAAVASPPAAPAAAAAGVSQPAPAGAVGILKGTLGPEYIDPSFGFSLRALAGATLDRRKRTVEDRLQVAQFVRLDVAWSMAVRLWASKRPVDVGVAEEVLGFNLALQYPDATVTRAEAIRVDSREAIRLAASFSGEGQTWLRQEAVIQLRPKEYVLVLLTTPGDDRELAAQVFDQVLASFRVVRTEAQQKEIDAALARGIQLRERVAEGGKRITDLVGEPVSLRVLHEGQAVGLLEIREAPARIGGEDGVRSVQQAWLFNPDQSVQFLQEEKFVSQDLAYDEWRNMTQTMPSKQVDPQQRVVVHMEAGIRRGDQLLVKYAGTNAEEKQEKAIEIEPSYAPGAWPLLFPRLVDLKTPELYAFSMYDSERRGMTLRTFRVVGPEHVLAGGRRLSGYKIEDSEGLVPPINEVVVNEQGQLIRLAAGPVEMIVTRAEQLEQEFGERIRATQKQFRENAGLPEPSQQPAARENKPAARKPAVRKPGSGSRGSPRRPSRGR